MNVLRRVERGLEGAVNGAFARAFRSDVQPVEIASALQHEMDGTGRVLSRDRRLVPNVFEVALSRHDHERLAPYAGTLTDDLEATTSEYAAGQGYVFPGAVRVLLVREESLATGRFEIRSRAEGDDRARDQRRGGGRDGRGRSDGEDPRAAWARGRGPVPAAPAYADAGFAEPPGSHVPGFDPDPGEPARWETRTFEPVPDLPPRQRGRTTPFAELHVHGGERVPVELPGAVIGRASDADVRVDDPGASRRHAEIRIVWDGDRYDFWLVDLHSTNGTVVDGRRTPEAKLVNGSRITIGATTLLLRIDESRLATG